MFYAAVLCRNLDSGWRTMVWKGKGKERQAGHHAPLSLSRTIPICCTSGLPWKSSLGEMSLLLEGKEGEEEKRMKRKTFEKKAHDPRPF